MRLIAMCLPLLLSLAQAATLETTNAPLVAEIAARRAALPTSRLSPTQRRQKSALDRAGKALAHDATTLSATVRDARRVALALDATFRGDTTFDGLLSSLVASLTSTVSNRLAALTAGRDALTDGSAKRKVTKRVSSATRALSGASTAATRTSALGLLYKAATAIVSGERALGTPGGGGGGPTSTTFTLAVGDPVTDEVRYPATPHGPLDRFTTVAATNGGTTIFTLSATAGATTTYSIMLFVIGPAVGERPMTVTGSALTAIPGGTSSLVSGTVRFTTWDPGAGKCEGTFTATFGSTPVTGSFSDIGMIVQ